MFKTILIYVFEVLIAIAIISYSLKAFLVYLFLIFLLVSYKQYNHLRKMMRIYQVANEAKLGAVVKKLKITNEEIKDVVDEMENNNTEEDWKSLEKDFTDLLDKKQ